MTASWELPVVTNVLERSIFCHICGGKLQDMPISFAVTVHQSENNLRTTDSSFTKWIFGGVLIKSVDTFHFLFYSDKTNRHYMEICVHL